MKSLIRLVGRFLLRRFGFDPKVILSYRNLPQFLKNKKEWLRQGGFITHSYPVLNDFFDNAGTASGHYFHQDLLIAT